MKLAGPTIFVFLLAMSALAAMTGTFRGTIVDPGTKSSTDEGWIYVQGRNQMVRRVQVADAKVVYAADFPAAMKAPKPASALTGGVEVRVTASQDGKGEWRATTVEILKPPRESGRSGRTKM